MKSPADAALRRRQITYAALLFVIFATLPCYCVGVFLLILPPPETPEGSAPQGAETQTDVPMMTHTITVTPSPKGGTLQPTPEQFVPPTHTPFIPPPTHTPYVPPTSPVQVWTPSYTPTNPPTHTPGITPTHSPTLPPTYTNSLTPEPTNTQIPTDTPIPTVTDTLRPTDTPLPTATPTLTFTPSPTGEAEPLGE